MSSRPAPHPVPEPKASPTTPEAGYDKWLADEIAAGEADIEAGRVAPAEQVWSELDIE